jgi:uncharacterized protein YihD (DUF1040 family)
MTIREAKIIAKKNGYRILNEGWDSDPKLNAIEFFEKTLKRKGFQESDDWGHVLEDGESASYFLKMVGDDYGWVNVCPDWINNEDPTFAKNYEIVGMNGDGSEEQVWHANSNEECLEAIGKALAWATADIYIK